MSIRVHNYKFQIFIWQMESYDKVVKLFTLIVFFFESFFNFLFLFEQ